LLDRIDDQPLPYAQQNRIPEYTIFEVNDNGISISVYEVDKNTPIDKFEVKK